MFELIVSSIKDTLIYSLGNIFVRISGFILLPLFLAHLTPSEYGILGILEISTQILVNVFSLSLFLPLMRWYWDSKYADQRKKMFFTVLFFSALMAVTMFLLITPLASKISNALFHSQIYENLIFLMLLVAGLQIIVQIPASLLRVQGRAGLYTTSYLVNFSVSTVLTIVFIVYFRMKVDGIYLAHGCGYFVQFLILLRVSIENSKLEFDWPLLKEMLAFSLPIALSSVVGTLVTVSDRYILNILGQLKDVGIYSLSFKIANTLNLLIINPALLAMTPLIYKRMEAENNRRFYAKIMTYMTFGVMFFILGISLFGQEIIKLFTKNKEYWLAYQFIPILSFALLFSMLKELSLIGLNITKKTKIVGIIVSTFSVLNVVFNFIFIHFFGTLGAALGVFITYLLLFVAIYRSAQRVYKIPYEVSKIAMIIGIGAIITAFALLLSNTALWFRAPIKLLLIGIYPLILYKLNFFEPVELQAINRIWNTWRNPLHWKSNLIRFLTIDKRNGVKDEKEKIS